MTAIDDSTRIALGVLAVLLIAALYIWTAVALSAVFRTSGGQGWKGWVPVLNQIVLLQLGRLSGWLYLLVLVPFAGPLILWALLIVACYRINASFGHGAGMTVLAALLLPVWASILGFGPARRLGTEPAGREPGAGPGRTGLREPEDQYVPRATPPVSAVADDSAAPIVEDGARSAITPDRSLTDPPVAEPLVTSVPAPAEPVPEPESWAPRGSVSAQHAEVEIPQDPLNQTVITRRGRTAWSLVPPSGAAVPITADVVFLGRKPAPDRAFPEAQLIPIDDGTVSKTHARLELRDDRWYVTDLGSTNGLLVATLTGTEVEAAPGAEIEAGERFFLGDAEVKLQRNGG